MLGNEIIECLCGCRITFLRLHPKWGYERKYLPGHNSVPPISAATKRSISRKIKAIWADPVKGKRRRKRLQETAKTPEYCQRVRDGIAKSTKRQQMGAQRCGISNPNWKGGSYCVNGYIKIRVVAHPKGPYVPEQVLIAEAILGRYLKYFGHNHPKNEEVHHINKKRADNRNCNLLVCTRSYHTSLQQRERKQKKRRG